MSNEIAVQQSQVPQQFSQEDITLIRDTGLQITNGKSPSR